MYIGLISKDITIKGMINDSCGIDGITSAILKADLVTMVQCLEEIFAGKYMESRNCND